jgi:hypothetical protein
MAIAAYPQIVYDADHNFGEDLSLSATGDLQLSSGSTMSNQRILRRLFTNPGEYIWHTEYGGGINQFVGVDLSGTAYDQITANITANIFQEATVSQTPPPNIVFQTTQGGLYVGISYAMAATLEPTVLNFQVQ